jgi:signal transduction histidine kinase
VTEQRRTQAQLVEQQRTLAALHEREQLARELHDSIGQVLGYASLQVAAAAHLIDDGQPAKAEVQLTRLAAVLQDAHADVREQILNLRTAPSPQQPLFATIDHYLDGFTNNYAIGTKLAIGEGLCDEMLAPKTQSQVCRILQEALSNTRKHSNARSVEVTFTARNGTLRMCIADDGCGFAPGATTGDGGHLGLHFMRERAAELGGSLQIESAPGAGARVAVEIPRQEC